MKEINRSLVNEFVLLTFIFFRLFVYIVLMHFFDFSISFYYGILVLIMPMLYLHFKYLLNDEGKKVYLYDEKMFLVLKDGKEINLTEAEQVVFHCHVGLTRPNIPFLINPDYYNVVFTMPDGQMFSVSSILDRKLKIYIYGRFKKEIIRYKYFALY